MTRDEKVRKAISVLIDCAEAAKGTEFSDYYLMGADALRQQEKTPCSRCGYGGKHLDAPPCTTCPAHPKEQRPNEPLTLDEMRKMDGEPVWWWNKSAKPVCTICVWDRFMNEPMFANYDWQSEYTLQLSKYKWLKKCGYKPYRPKPEEGTELPAEENDHA